MQHRFPAEPGWFARETRKVIQHVEAFRCSHVSSGSPHTLYCKMTTALLHRCSPLTRQRSTVDCLFCSHSPRPSSQKAVCNKQAEKKQNMQHTMEHINVFQLQRQQLWPFQWQHGSERQKSQPKPVAKKCIIMTFLHILNSVFDKNDLTVIPCCHWCCKFYKHWCLLTERKIVTVLPKNWRCHYTCLCLLNFTIIHTR